MSRTGGNSKKVKAEEVTMTVKIARILLSLICVAFVANANAEEVEPLASWSQTVMTIGPPHPAWSFNFFAVAAGIPPASRQDTLRGLSVGNEAGLERRFVVREGGSPKRTDIGLMEGKGDDFRIYVTNPRGDLKWAGYWDKDTGYVSTPLRDAHEPFAVELEWWQGFEKVYDEKKAKAEDDS